jgi:hypothetical protein
MGSYKVTRYTCDKCGGKLSSDSNVIIQTTICEDWYSWSRLKVTIEHHYGMHNDGKTEPADLCKKCTVELLKDALKRVQEGERISAGIDGIEDVEF